MGLAVVTVASGGLPVIQGTVLGLPVTEAVNARGIAVTKVTSNGLPVVFVTEAGVVVPSAATWDPATAFETTLSNGNLTATHSTTNSNTGVFGKPSASSGKYYFELLATAVGVSESMGLVTTTGTFNNLLSGTNCVCVFKSGNINSNNISSGKALGGGGIVNGNVIGLAVDLTARKAWFRRGSGLWNGLVIGSEDPVAGLGGVVVAPTVSFLPAIAFSSGTGQIYTANFGATAFANAAPSGFVNWPAS